MQELESKEGVMMACRYIDRCPCASGWCESPRQDYEQCIPFLLTVYEREQSELERCENKLEKIKKIL